MGLALVGKGGGGRSTKLQVRADALMAARESRGFDVISCLRCVVAGVRYIGPIAFHRERCLIESGCLSHRWGIFIGNFFFVSDILIVPYN